MQNEVGNFNDQFSDKVIYGGVWCVTIVYGIGEKIREMMNSQRIYVNKKNAEQNERDLDRVINVW